MYPHVAFRGGVRLAMMTALVYISQSKRVCVSHMRVFDIKPLAPRSHPRVSTSHERVSRILDTFFIFSFFHESTIYTEIRPCPSVAGPLLAKRIVGVSMGLAHTAAVADDGSVFTWGQRRLRAAGPLAHSAQGTLHPSPRPAAVRSRPSPEMMIRSTT